MKHVGGHNNKTWTDIGALSSIKMAVGGETFLDVGCGPGGQILEARKLGFAAYGVDGDPTFIGSYNVAIHDYNIGPFGKAEAEAVFGLGTFDIGWSVEFLEHVYTEFIPNYMETYKLCKYLIITHATPGQGGQHHVNEQLFEYWNYHFNQHGFEHSLELTAMIRENSTMREKKLNHFQGFDSNGIPINKKLRSSFIKKTGRVFCNKNLI